MNLQDYLKQLKSIEPNPEYVLRSRSVLVGHSSKKPFAFFRVFEAYPVFSGLAIILLLSLGGVSVWKAGSPSGINGLEPGALRAEADAIDIQIQLTELNYSDPAPQENTPESTPRRVVEAVKNASKALLGGEGVIELEPPSFGSGAPIDEALEALSE